MTATKYDDHYLTHVAQSAGNIASKVLQNWRKRLLNRRLAGWLFGLGQLLISAPAAAALPTERFVEAAPGIQLHVLIQGAQTRAPTIVLIPGWRLSAGIWRDQMSILSARAQVIAVDPRSQGESTKTGEGNTPEVRAQDIHAVLTQLTQGDVVLVGWSQGVQDVAAYIDKFGDDGLAGLVLIDASVSAGAGNVTVSPQIAAQQLRRMAQYEAAPQAYTEGLMRAITRHPLSPAELEELVSEAMKTPTATGAAMLIDDLYGPDRTQALAKVMVPTQVIASAYSPELEAQRTMAGRIPGARFVVVQDAGHAVFLDQPDRFDELMEAFLDGLPAGQEAPL